MSSGPGVPAPSLAALRVASVASLLLTPLLLWQGRRVRRTVTPLGDAAGPATGECLPDGAHTTALPLALLVVGESTVAGMGAATHADALTGRTAAALAQETGRAVRWRALGESGATARRAAALVRQAADAGPLDADVAVVALGVNDVLRFRPDPVWALELADVVATLRARTRATLPVVVAAVPPMHAFPALPQPLRLALGAHARLLDAAAARWAAGAAGVVHAPTAALEAVATRGLFAPDGFHPSGEGYRVWGESLARVAAAALGAARGVATAA